MLAKYKPWSKSASHTLQDPHFVFLLQFLPWLPSVVDCDVEVSVKGTLPSPQLLLARELVKPTLAKSNRKETRTVTGVVVVMTSS